jgi:hypothetical protein
MRLVRVVIAAMITVSTFNTAFSSSDVSTVDYFHPSVQGQDKLASVTWAASYWATS